MIWRPEILDTSRSDHSTRLAELRTTARVSDQLLEQQKDLLESREPGRRFREEDFAAGLPAIQAEGSRWIWYPWSGELVHLLPPGPFRELRLDRNRHKITREEQDRLGASCVAVVGLSVGNAIATTLALEGVCGRLKLADMDSLSLSNLNRIRAKVSDLGLPKTVLAARQIAEIDPYLEVEIFSEGLLPENLDAFLEGVDILVEECDNIGIKALVRQGCRARRIPVLMETSDRGMLDVERYDQDPGLPLLHGLLPEWDYARYSRLDEMARIGLVAKVVGRRSVSPRAAASLLELRSSIRSWPQLGSEVVLGGATVTCAVRKITLGEGLESGRRYVDLAALLQGAPLPLPAGPPPVSPPPPPSEKTLIEELIAAAVRAPSGGNCQPWIFHVEGSQIRIEHDTQRSASLLDFRGEAAHVALGAATENLVIAASEQGLAAEVQAFPEPTRPEIVAQLSLRPAGVSPDPLAPFLPLRRTDRRVGPRLPLEPEQVEALRAEIGPAQSLRLLTTEEKILQVGDVIGAVDKVRFLHAHLHAEMMAEIRWSEAEAAFKADGMGVDEMEASDADLAIMGELSRPEVAAFLRKIGGGGRLGELARTWLRGSAAVGLLSARSNSLYDAFMAGRQAQRLWLRANGMGLGIQPVGVVSYMVRHLGSEVEQGYLPKELEVLRWADQRLKELFEEGPGEYRLLLFRIQAGLSSAAPRSRRRPLAEVIRYGTRSLT